MNLKFKSALVAFALAAVGSASAESSAVIRWQVTDAKIGTETAEFGYAMFKVDGVPGGYLFVDPASGLTGVDFLGSTAFPGGVSASTGEDHMSAFSEGTADYASDDYSFYVELYDANQELFARSVDTWSYDYLYSTANCITDDPSAWTGHSTFVVSSFTAVPEPTSGLMLLAGMALLGLKRKQV